MLRELGQVFPGRELASVLGISILTLDGWRKGKNGPCAAARKLVWLLWAAIFRPDCVQTAFDVITWGRFTVQERCRHQSPLTASAEDWSI